MKGQALIEYILILSIMAFIAVAAVRNVSKSFNVAIVSMTNIISTHLTVGVCGSVQAGGRYNCFFSGYYNGKEN